MYQTRQQHGFDEEEHLIKNHSYYRKPENENYTAEYDCYIKTKDIEYYPENVKNIIKKNYEIPVSVKTKKLNQSVEMASLQRNANIKSDFILSVAFWEKEKNNIVGRDVLLIPKDVWLKEFPEELVKKMLNIFVDNNITNSYDDDKKWRLIRREYKKIWKESGSNINVLFKRDHKNQLRLQCSIKKPFYNYLLKNYSIKVK